MVKTVDIPALQESLYNKLKPSGWADVLKSFLLGSDFTNILEELYEQSMEGKKFTPLLKDLFTAFEECPYKELHTVFINKEPFYAINTANGIAFDSSRTQKEHVYTGLMFDAIQRTIYQEKVYKRELNLSRWSNQGILLLNANLTVQIDKSCTHDKIWKPFTAFLLDTLSTRNCGLVFVFVGDDVKYLASLINNKAHYRYSIPHPSVGLQSKVWDSQNIFPILSKLIHKNYKRTIVW